MEDTVSASEPAAPLRIGPYRVTELLGRGGMGIVYRARDSMLARDIALKVLPYDRVSSATSRARMLREARALAALSHPNICAIHQSGDDAGQIWIAMELLPGPTLASRLTADLTDDEILRWSIGIARALAFAHRAGLVHRDLKPSNVMIDRTGEAKLVDFGLVKVIEPGDASDARLTFETEHGAILGTPRYMSPEQARGDKTGPPTDVFSLGLVIYELVTCSTRPRTSRDHVPAFARTWRHPLGRGVEPKLACLIADCLAADPRERPTADDVIIRLGEIRSICRPRWQWTPDLRVAAIATGVLAATVGASVAHKHATDPSEISVSEFDPATMVTAAAFAPDGQLYYVARNPKSRLWRTRPSGGSELVPGIGEIYNQVSCCYRDMVVVRWKTGVMGIEPGTDRVVELPQLATAVSVARTGTVVAERNPACPFGDGLVLRVVGSYRALVTRCNEPGHFVTGFQWSPNGRRFAYAEYDGQRFNVFSIDLDAYLEPRLVTIIPAAWNGRLDPKIAWKSSERLLVPVHVQETHETGTWAPRWNNTILEIEIGRNGEPLERASYPFGARFVEPIAATRTSIAIQETRTEINLMHGSLATSPLTLFAAAPTNQAIWNYAGWSADGRIVTPLNNRKTYSTELAIWNIGGVPSVILPEDPETYVTPLAVTTLRNTEQILFIRTFARRQSLWIVQIDGNHSRELIPDIPAGTGAACASGRCVIATPDESSIRIATLDLDNGQTQHLFSTYERSNRARPAISSDGRLVAIINSDSSLLIHDRATNSVEERHIPGGRALQSVAFANDRDLIFTENKYLGGRGLVRLSEERAMNGERIVDVLSPDASWYIQPIVDWDRNRILVNRGVFPDALSIVRVAP